MKQWVENIVPAEQENEELFLIVHITIVHITIPLCKAQRKVPSHSLPSTKCMPVEEKQFSSRKDLQSHTYTE